MAIKHFSIHTITPTYRNHMAMRPQSHLTNYTSYLQDVSLGSKIVRMIVAGNSLAEQVSYAHKPRTTPPHTHTHTHNCLHTFWNYQDSLSDPKDKTKAQKQKEVRGVFCLCAQSLCKIQKRTNSPCSEYRGW